MASQPFDPAQLWLAAVVSSSDDAIVSKDATGTITSWNRAAERMFGYTVAEAVGQPIRLIVPPALYQGEDEILRRILAGQAIEHYETSRLRKDGTEVEVSVTVSAITTPDGQVIGASHIARDVGERKRLERGAWHFAAIVNSSDDAIISKDLNGTILSWNPAAERLFGYSPDEAIGKSIRMIIPADRRAEEDHVLTEVRSGHMVRHFETVRIRKDGSEVPISLTVSPIRSSSGEIIGVSKMARDMGETRRMERDAFRLAAIMDSSDDAIVSKDLNSIVRSWNRAAESMFGFTAAEMIGRSIRTLIPDELQNEEDHVLSQISAGKRVEHYETIRRRKNGTLIPVSLTVSPLRDARGVVVGASKIARDISEQKRAEIERQQLLTVAQEAGRLKDEFLATLSHELRTPLNAIVGYTRMMQSGFMTPDKQRRALATVGRNATALAQIAEDVLDVSRIVSGKLRISVQPVDLASVIAEAVDTVRPAADAKGIELVITLNRTVPLVSGDPDRLQQVLWNLLSNAVKFTDRTGRVEVRLDQTSSHVTVTVSDTGIGIAPEFLPHVFERFRQADAGIGRVQGGLGFGLAITSHLAEMQGGRVHAESAGRGKGAMFRVELPIRDITTFSPAAAHQKPAAMLDASPLSIPALNGVRVLVVDDEPDALALLSEILELTGALVSMANSGESALHVLEDRPIDVIVADIGMPVMDGFKLIERIRRSPRRAVRDIPAAALTAYARSGDRAKALRKGFQLHLTKPIEPRELMVAIVDLRRRSSITRE